MLPPDRAYRREANAKSVPGTQQNSHNYQSQQQQQQQQLSTMQKVMRFAERDDLLLYLTAAFGIIMPAIMYFFYRTMHNKYHAYCKKVIHLFLFSKTFNIEFFFLTLKYLAKRKKKN